jgi:thiosulfate/3-mercaptopyruvate sulfurtransferase
MTIKIISTDDLIPFLDNPDIALIDLRPPEAFNGWKLKNEARGGHIPGAISFPQTWTERFSRSRLVSVLSSKGITSKNTVILYGYRGDQESDIASLLVDCGTQEIFFYQDGLQEWAADPRLPMDKLPYHEKLVYPDWIRQFQSGQKPDHDPGQNFRLFEVSWQNEEDYQSGHIPGAVLFDLTRIENPKTWNVCPDKDLFAFLAAQGISQNSACILYGRNIMATARTALILLYAGVADVRVLDGGFGAWINAGFELESKPHRPTPIESFGRNTPVHPEYIVGIKAVKKMLQHNQGLLVSVRSWDEYCGKTSGYDYIQPRGRIAGAVWGFSGTDPHRMEDYRNPDETMRSYHEISKNWEKRGIKRDQRLTFYCGSGWRASEAFFYAHVLGWKQIGVYDGGWYEWSQDPDNPIESGIPNFSV